MNTVNVIKIPDTSDKRMAIQQLVSFPATEQGTEDAEMLFRRLVTERYPEAEDEIAAAIDEGFFTRDNYYVALVHSTPESRESDSQLVAD